MYIQLHFLCVHIIKDVIQILLYLSLHFYGQCTEYPKTILLTFSLSMKYVCQTPRYEEIMKLV